MGSCFFSVVGGGAMQCEWCRSNLASFKFSDTQLEDGATKVVCGGCFHMLSLSCIRQDLAVLHKKVTAIEHKVGADLEESAASAESA